MPAFRSAAHRRGEPRYPALRALHSHRVQSAFHPLRTLPGYGTDVARERHRRQFKSYGPGLHLGIADFVGPLRLDDGCDGRLLRSLECAKSSSHTGLDRDRNLTVVAGFNARPQPTESAGIRLCRDSQLANRGTIAQVRVRLTSHCGL